MNSQNLTIDTSNSLIRPSEIGPRRISIDGAFSCHKPLKISLIECGVPKKEIDNFMHHYNQGMQYYKDHDYAKAITSFNQSIKTHSLYADAHYNKSLALKATEDYQSALEACNKAVEIAPDNILYLCTKGRILIQLNNKQGALTCFNKAHALSESEFITSSLTAKNLAFIDDTLQERTKVLKKITEVEQAAIENQEIIDAFKDQEHPVFREAIQHFLSLREAKTSCIEEFVGQLSATTEEKESANDTSPKTANSKKFQDLYDTNHKLAEQLENLQQALLQQKEYFLTIIRRLGTTQEEILTTVEQHETTLEEHSVSIDRLNNFAEELEIDKQRMDKLLNDLEDKGFDNLDSILSYFSNLKTNLSNNAELFFEQPGKEASPYDRAFFYTLKRDLIASQSSAMLVTNADIIHNNKKGSAGAIGDILEIAGDLIPSFGGYVQFFAAILNAADHQNQHKIVKQLADIASGPIEMEHIASTVSRILTKDYLDKSIISSNQISFKQKIIGYLQSVLDEISDSDQSTPKISDSQSTPNKGESIFSCFLFGRHTRAPSKIDSQLKEQPKLSEDLAFFQDPIESLSADEDAQIIDKEEARGASDAHLISSIIIKAVYKGQVSAHFGDQETIIQRMLEAVFSDFEMDIDPITQILHDELSYIPNADIRTTTRSQDKPLSEQISQEILDEVKKQIKVSKEFDSSFMLSMTARLETSYSQTKIHFVDSLTQSSDFQKILIGQIVEILVQKLRENSEIIPTLKFVRGILKEAETTLRQDEESFATDQNPNEILVWNCNTVYENPILEDKAVMRQLANLETNQQLMLLDIGKQDPEAAEALLSNIKTYGFDNVANIIFNSENTNEEEILTIGDYDLVD